MFYASPAAAVTFDAFYGFGDSSIDSGWWAGALNGQCGPVASPCATGNSNKDDRIAAAIANGGTGKPVGVGLMDSEIIAQHFGLTALPANQPGGTNYAIPGSKSTADGGGNLNPNPNLPSTVEQITTYLVNNGGAANPNGLYMISSGGNDSTYAANTFTSGDTATNIANAEAFLADQAQALANAIDGLQQAGANHLVVNGLQGEGLYSRFFTTTLWQDLTDLGVNFIAPDIRTLVETVIANPEMYGFTAATVVRGINGSSTGSACVSGAGSGWGQWCADTTTPGSNYAHLRAADAEQTSFYSDNSHYSAAGQEIVAQYEIGLIEDAYPNATPLPASLPLFAGGLGGLGYLNWRRRRRAAR